MNKEITTKLVKYGFDIDTIISAWERVQEKGFIDIGYGLWLFTLKAIKREFWYGEDKDFSAKYESSDDTLVFLHGEDSPVEITSLQDLLETLADMITI